MLINIRKVLILLFIVISFGISARADVTRQLNYQGRLTDSNGVPVADGNYDISFEIFNALTAGSSIWGPETHSAVPVESGLFSALLGSSVSLSSVNFNQDCWLEITVDSTTYSPRQQLTGVTYALTVPELSITNAKLADSSVNSSKVQNNTLAADDLLVNVVSSVDGVTNDGGNIDLVEGSGITITPNDTANTITIAANTSTLDQWVDEAGDTMSGDLDMGDNAITNIDWSTSDDGTGSGLDADLLDGQHGSYYRDASNINAGTLNNARFSAYSDLTAESKIGTGSTQVAAGNHNHDATYMPIAQDDWVDEAGDTMSGALNMGDNAITNINWATSDDGAGSGLDADLLDGQHGSYYTDASNINAGTLNNARFSAYSDLTAESKIGTGATQVAAGNHNHDATYMPIAQDDWVDETGDTMSGNLIVNANIGVNVASPASQLHVDDTAQIGTDGVAQNTNMTMWAENGYEATLILRETPTHGMGLRYNADSNFLYIDRYPDTDVPSPVMSIFRDSGATTFFVDVDMGNNALTNIDWSTSDDGSGSSLDADLLDGLDSTAFMTASSDDWVDEAGDTMSGTLNMGDNAITNINWGTSDDGTGSGLDADLLDGQHGSYYRDASNINAGTLNNARFSAYSDLSAESKIGTGSTQVAAGDHNHDAAYMPISQDDWVDEAGDTMTGNLNMGNNNITGFNALTSYTDTSYPKIVLDSSGSGDNTVEQAAEISLGESGSAGAALHLTYTGDGYAHLGMGTVSSAVPAYEAQRFYYTDSNTRFYGNAVMQDNSILDANTVQANTLEDPEDTTISINDNAAITGDLTVSGSDIYITDTNTRLTEGSNNSLRVQTNYGYVDMGPQNSSFSHFNTDIAGGFYFNTKASINGNADPYTDNAFDLGTSSKRWRNLYISGTANVNALSCTDCIGTTQVEDIYVLNSGDTMTGILNMNNSNITNVGHLTIADPGANEGFAWTGSSAGWTIDVSPTDRSNADGNLNLYGTANSIMAWRPLIVYESSDASEASVQIYGSSQGTGRLYVGQSTTYGGGIIYNGDGTPSSNTTTDHVSLYRRYSGTDFEVLHWSYGNSNVIAEADLRADGKLTGQALSTWGIQTKQGPTSNADDQWHEVTCDSYYAMSNVSIYATAQLDGYITPMCHNLGDLVSSSGSWTTPTSNGDDQWHSATCPSGYVARGIKMYANTRLDYGLSLYCTAPASGVSGVSTTHYISQGADACSEDDTWHAVGCPAGTYISAIAIYCSGSYLDGDMKVKCTALKPN